MAMEYAGGCYRIPAFVHLHSGGLQPANPLFGGIVRGERYGFTNHHSNLHYQHPYRNVLNQRSLVLDGFRGDNQLRVAGNGWIGGDWPYQPDGLIAPLWGHSIRPAFDSGGYIGNHPVAGNKRGYVVQHSFIQLYPEFV